MKSISLLLRVLAIVGAIVAAVGWFATDGKVKQANDEISNLESQLKQAQNTAAEFEKKHSDVSSRVAGLQSDLTEFKSRATSARSQLVQAQRDTTAVRDELRASQAEVKDLEEKNENLRREITDARIKVAEVDPEKIKQYEEKIAQLGEEVDTLKDKLAIAARGSSTQIVPTSSDATAADGSAAATPAVVPRLAKSGETASVLKADVDNGLIIISRGQKQGLQQAMEFGIAKDYSVPVRVKVARTTPDFSVAYILPGKGGNPIFEAGDKITLVQ